MYKDFQNYLNAELKAIEDAGLYKNERIIVSPQKADIKVSTGKEVLNFCANNYIGLSNSSVLINAAKKALDERVFGLSSFRFICGTHVLHKELEKIIAEFFETEYTSLYAACF